LRAFRLPVVSLIRLRLRAVLGAANSPSERARFRPNPAPGAGGGYAPVSQNSCPANAPIKATSRAFTTSPAASSTVGSIRRSASKARRRPKRRGTGGPSVEHHAPAIQGPHPRGAKIACPSALRPRTGRSRYAALLLLTLQDESRLCLIATHAALPYTSRPVEKQLLTLGLTLTQSDNVKRRATS
jgi:hypothetical protein